MHTIHALKHLGQELYRRRVVHVAALYLGGYLGGLQGLEPFLGTLGLGSGATERALSIFTVLALGAFPLVLICAWYYRVLKEEPDDPLSRGPRPDPLGRDGHGVGAEAEGEPPSAIAVADGTWLTTATVLLLTTLLSVSLGAWLWIRLVPAVASGNPSASLDPDGVAILYPETVVGDEATRQFADGLTARLITGLGGVRGLRVPPPAAVQPLRGAGLTPDSVARLLNVASVITPTVEALGGQVRVTMTLIDGFTGESRGSVDVTDDQPDRFEIYDQVAESLLNELRTALGRDLEMRRSILGTDNAQAWGLFRRATDRAADRRDLLGLGDLDGALSALAEADSLLADAVRADPGYVEALVKRGEFAEIRAILLVPLDPEGHMAALATARVHVNGALRAAPDDPQALALGGLLAFELAYSELESASRRRELLDSAWSDLSRAVDRHPEPARVYRTMADVQAARGETAGALQLARRARDYDAFLRVDDALLQQLFTLAFEVGRDDEATQWCMEGRRRFPQNWAFLECRLWLLGWGTGPADTVTALAVRDTAFMLVPQEFRGSVASWLGTLLAASYARSGAYARAEAMLREAASSDMSGLGIAAAGVWLLLGDREEALGQIEAYAEAVPAQAASIRSFRVLAPMREDPALRRLAGFGGAD